MNTGTNRKIDLLRWCRIDTMYDVHNGIAKLTANLQRYIICHLLSAQLPTGVASNTLCQYLRFLIYFSHFTAAFGLKRRAKTGEEGRASCDAVHDSRETRVLLLHEVRAWGFPHC